MELSNITKEKLKNLGVAVVYLFGSRVDGTASERSDYDVGVVFFNSERVCAEDPHLFTSVYDILSDDLPDQLNGVKMDISLLQKANAALEVSAVNNGAILFNADPVFKANYEEAVVKRYDDYLPLKRKYEEVTFSAFTK